MVDCQSDKTRPWYVNLEELNNNAYDDDDITWLEGCDVICHDTSIVACQLGRLSYTGRPHSFVLLPHFLLTPVTKPHDGLPIHSWYLWFFHTSNKNECYGLWMVLCMPQEMVFVDVHGDVFWRIKDVFMKERFFWLKKQWWLSCFFFYKYVFVRCSCGTQWPWCSDIAQVMAKGISNLSHQSYTHACAHMHACACVHKCMRVCMHTLGISVFTSHAAFFAGLRMWNVCRNSQPNTSWYAHTHPYNPHTSSTPCENCSIDIFVYDQL